MAVDAGSSKALFGYWAISKDRLFKLEIYRPFCRWRMFVRQEVAERSLRRSRYADLRSSGALQTFHAERRRSMLQSGLPIGSTCHCQGARWVFRAQRPKCQGRRGGLILRYFWKPQPKGASLPRIAREELFF